MSWLINLFAVIGILATAVVLLVLGAAISGEQDDEEDDE